LAATELRVAEERMQISRERAQAADIQLLAQIALRHLGKHCPVCAQSYDVLSTRERLLKITEQDLVARDINSVTLDSVVVLTSNVQERERDLRSVTDKLQTAEQELRTYRLWLTQRDTRLKEIGQPALEALPELIERYEGLTSQLMQHQKSGEALTVAVGRVSETARRRQLESAAVPLREAVTRQRAEIQSYERTGASATRILEALRDAGTDIVSQHVDRIGPVLDRIFSRIDPHPAFRAVKLSATFSNRKGRLSASVHDRAVNKQSEQLKAVLSSSQANALAVSVFLSLNLCTGELPFEVAILDDPLQSLDDVNLLGLVDVLRRVRQTRQLIVSTHEPRFARLLERKLRPVTEQQRTRLIEFQSWSRQGPNVSSRDAGYKDETLRLVG
jgi:DNA repair exonuclease SbcCD ATPase subunit